MTKSEGENTQSLSTCHLGCQEKGAVPRLHVDVCIVEQTFKDQKITKVLVVSCQC